jgi:hypothetical protein
LYNTLIVKENSAKMSPNSTPESVANQTSADLVASRLVEAYQSLGHGDSTLVEALYADDIYFEDPTQGTQGKAALMLSSDADVFISWTQIFTHKKLAAGKTIRVEGSTYLKTRSGKIYYQRDYFDLGAVVYENLPIIGPIIKRLRSRIR